MRDEAVKIIEVLEKPLRFVAAQNFQNMAVVKNIPKHVQDQCARASQYIEDADKKKLLHQIHGLFGDFDRHTPQEQAKLVQRAIQTIDELKQTPSIAFGYDETDHPVYTLDQIKDSYMVLTSRVQYAKGVGPALAEVFIKNKVTTLYDLLHVLPHRYEDRTTMHTISALQEDQTATFMATVTYAGTTFYKGSRKKFFEVMLEDDTGQLRLKWFRFHQASLQKKFKKDQKVIVTGKVKIYQDTKEVHHPDVEVYTGGKEGLSFGKLVPIYSELGGIYQKTLRKIMYFLVLQYCEKRLELIPPALAQKYNFLPPWKVLMHLHQPDKPLLSSEMDRLKRHLAFEELFFYALAYGLRKQNAQHDGIKMDQVSPKIDRVRSSLSFELTDAQNRALTEILDDMKKPTAMNRLLQGDVGSGKTIVAFMAALHAIENGHQVAFMAPTELLATQHGTTMQAWADAVGIRVEYLLGKHTKAEKQAIANKLQRGDIDLIVGTHALIEDYVQYQSLGLVIIDEQHRFGVRQKDRVRASSMKPDVLIMSATPIPRSLAMTLFGDIDVSVLNEMPKGRSVIATTVQKQSHVESVYQDIRDTVAQGQQVFMVYPLVESSQYLDAKDATGQFEHFQQHVFADQRVGLLHGQMKADEKDAIMQKFAGGEIDILVATTVIEVGIDVPNATLMVIEHPERFGLAQLHQLRGRVGRGSLPGRCILVQPDALSVTARHRLTRFAEIHDGFELAQEDLKVRGPGDFFGVAQSGMPHFSAAAFPRDLDLLETTRREALDILSQDPNLTSPGHQHLQWVLDTLWQHRTRYIDVA